ncbi:MAG: D-alanyl-D-alanine carboxypeptidase [Clostridia bacterium]|nr:D-alanyl-D-alanine carboxypeptidase [Clostridia bacterium]
MVINADTLEIIYRNNPNVKRPMASTTKIMTGLLLAESGRLDEEIECTAEMVTVEGSAMGLRAGDRISGKDLLFGLMLMSGNDAANVTAHFLAGNSENFAKLMNEKAKELGLLNTSFVTPSGLDAEEHYTTAFDLAKLTAAALKCEEFKNAVSSYTATVSFGNPKQKYTIKNHNRLLKEYDGCVGVKTGFTKKSGRCLVTAAERDGKRLIAVTLNDPNDWRDHKSLLDFGFEALTPVSFLSRDYQKNVKVDSGESDFVGLCFEDIELFTTSQNKENLKLEFILPDVLTAPVVEGERVGEVVLKNGDYEIKRVPVTALQNVGKAMPEQNENFKEKIIAFMLKMLRSF